MDYEKKYNAALKQAKKELKTCGSINCDAARQIFRLFPELKESEDERIRKLLVWQVYRNIEDEANDLAQSVYDGIKGHDPDLEESIEDWKKCLSWLENQKEQKPVQDMEEREYVRTLKSLIADFLRDKEDVNRGYYQDIYNWLDGRHIEQPEKDKDAIEVTPKQDYSGLTDFERAIHRGFLCAGVENVPVSIIKDTAQDCLAQVKPAEWSELDKLYRDNIIAYLNLRKDKNLPEDTKYPVLDAWIDWLKSLRPQPKAEWSEEDVKKLAKIRESKSGTLKTEMTFYRQGVRDAFNYKGFRPSLEAQRGTNVST